MRVYRVLVSFLPLLVLSGCGYIHFGRLPKTDAALEQAYSDLLLQRKILQQELVLARKETDTLRTALERAAGTPASTGTPEITRQLEQTSRELATLRASYARLQTEQQAGAKESDAAAQAKLAELQEKLATSLHDSTQLQQENTRLRRELEETRTENASLANQLNSSLAENQQARASLAQLNSDLVAQKNARTRAEQAAEALRAQLEAVMARAGRADSASPEVQSPPPPPAATAVNPLAALQLTKAPPSGAVPSVELHTTVERIRSTESTPAAAVDVRPADPATAAAHPTPAARRYTVQADDTLEKIAEHFYGAADQWPRIYAANADLLSANRGLKPGMELQVPEK